MADLQDTHRMFIQGFLNKNVFNREEVIKLYKHCCSMYRIPVLDSQLMDDLGPFVKRINFHIRSVHMEIKKGFDEETSDVYYVLVNTKDSDYTRLASDYTVGELEYFKKLVEILVESESGSITTLAALNLTEHIDVKMSKLATEELLKSLQQNKWINNHQGKLYLSVRSLLELDHYLKEKYPDLVTPCSMCKLTVLKGQICGNSSCFTKLHKHCAKRYFQNKPDRTCPSCRIKWPHEIAVTPHKIATSTVRSRKRRL